MVPFCQRLTRRPISLHPAEQVLDQVGGRQHPFEIRAQSQAHHSQRFLQPLA
jgi:hypothetical protein